MLEEAASWVVRPITHLIRLVHLAQSRRRTLYEVRAARGITLLREWLSPQQRTQFDNFRFFEVTGCDSGKSYRIQYGISANVFELDCDGRPHIGWCFIPVGNLVPGDVMLAQKIALETDERGALSVARQFCVPPLPSRLVIVSAS
jgi:hypothetical protein